MQKMTTEQLEQQKKDVRTVWEKEVGKNKENGVTNRKRTEKTAPVYLIIITK